MFKKDINKQIEKLESELQELKRIANKPKGIQLSESMKDINGKELKLNYKDATEYTRLIGSRLPTKEELENLTKEQKDNISDRWVWSGSPRGDGLSFIFDGYSGNVDYYHCSSEGSVLCVLSPEARLTNKGE